MDVSGIAVMILTGYFAQCSLIFATCYKLSYALHVGVPFTCCVLAGLALRFCRGSTYHEWVLVFAVAYSVVPMAHCYLLLSGLPEDLATYAFRYVYLLEAVSILSFLVGFIFFHRHIP